MQRVEFVDSYEEPMNYEIADLSDVDPAELITDADEINAIIRRAVTILWKDQVFTYDELAAHLARNYVVLPENLVERDELFESVIQTLWHREKELARAALLPLPSRVRYSRGRSKQLLHGIITPFAADENIKTENDNSANPEVTPEEIEIADVTPIKDALPPLTRLKAARYIFNKLTEVKVYETILDAQALVSAILREYPATDRDDVDAAISVIIQNGYAERRRTGKKKSQRWGVVMDQTTKHEILADMNDGSFEEGLRYMFGDTVEMGPSSEVSA